MFTEVDQALEWVMSRHGHSHDPEEMKQILAEAGSPQNTFGTVHAAGTNGKGSFVNYLSDILISQGRKTGMFTSPHLISHLDRIRIDGKWIPGETFMAYLNRYYDLITEQNLSMFEIDVLIAFSWFRDEHVDIAVIECGLGGRYDSTNVLDKPELSVITTVGFDHMERLGDTLGKIAWQKAGIIRDDSRVLAGNIPDEAMAVIEQEAENHHARLYRPLDYLPGENNSIILSGETFEISSDALYQRENAVLALTAAALLDIDITAPEVRKALKNSMWKGRFETVSTHPRVILDGAHNTHGVEALTKSLKTMKRPLVCVFAALRDKRGTMMAEMLDAVCDRLIVTEFDMYRADRAQTYLVDGAQLVTDWKEAITRAKEYAGKDGTVIITGSLYFISIVREYLMTEFK